MLNDEICKVRDKLNKSIENNKDYSEIYKISVELDDLIAKYYNSTENIVNYKLQSEVSTSLLWCEGTLNKNNYLVHT